MSVSSADSGICNVIVQSGPRVTSSSLLFLLLLLLLRALLRGHSDDFNNDIVFVVITSRCCFVFVLKIIVVVIISIGLNMKLAKLVQRLQYYTLIICCAVIYDWNKSLKHLN